MEDNKPTNSVEPGNAVDNSVKPGDIATTNTDPSQGTTTQGVSRVSQLQQLNPFNNRNALIKPNVATDTGAFADTTSYSPVSAKEYAKYFSEGVSELPNIQQAKARNQAAYSQLFNWAVQATGEVVGGTISGIGSIYEGLDYAMSSYDRQNADFTNIIMNVGEDISQWSREIAPIHRMNPNRAFDPGDFGWWAENGVSIASSLSMIIPARMVVGGARWLGRIAKLTDKVGDTAKFIGDAALSAVVMRNAENMRESMQVAATAKKDVYERLQGMDDETYADYLKTDIGQEWLSSNKGQGTKEDLARYVAAQSGWHSYNVNSVNIVFDFLQTATALKALSGASRTGAAGSRAVAKAQVAAIGKPLSRVGRFAAMASPTVGAFGAQLTEGIEEIINSIGSAEGAAFTKQALGEDIGTFDQRLEKNLQDPHTWNAGLWGVLGGVAFHGVQRLIESKGIKAVTQQKVAEIGNRASLMKNTLTALPILEKQYADGKISKTDYDSNKRVMFNTLGYQMGLSAAMSGNMNLIEDQLHSPEYQKQLEDSLTEEQKQSLGLTDTVGIDSVMQKLVEKARAAERIYNKYNNRVIKPGVSEEVVARQRALQMDAEFNLDTQRDELTKAELEVERLMPNMSITTSFFRESIQLKANREAKAILETALTSKNTTDKAKASIVKQIQLLKENNETLAASLDVVSPGLDKRALTSSEPDQELLDAATDVVLRKAIIAQISDNLLDLSLPKTTEEIATSLAEEKERKTKEAYTQFTTEVNNPATTSAKLESMLSNLESTDPNFDKKSKVLTKRIKDTKRQEAIAETAKRKAEIAEAERLKSTEAAPVAVTPVAATTAPAITVTSVTTTEPEVESATQSEEITTEKLVEELGTLKAKQVLEAIENVKYMLGESGALLVTELRKLAKKAKKSLGDLAAAYLNQEADKLDPSIVKTELVPETVEDSTEINAVKDNTNEFTGTETLPETSEPVVSTIVEEVQGKETETEITKEEEVATKPTRTRVYSVIATPFIGEFSAKKIEGLIGTKLFEGDVINTSYDNGRNNGTRTSITFIVKDGKLTAKGLPAFSVSKSRRRFGALIVNEDLRPAPVVEAPVVTEIPAVPEPAPIVVEETIVIDNTNYGSANIFVQPLAKGLIQKGDTYKASEEAVTVIDVVKAMQVGDDITLEVDTSNEYHKDNEDNAAIVIKKDGIVIGMLNIIDSIQTAIKNTEDPAAAKIFMTNLEATRKLRSVVWNNGNPVVVSTKVTKLTSGTLIKGETFIPVQDSLVGEFELYYADDGVAENVVIDQLISITGKDTYIRTGNKDFHNSDLQYTPGVFYALIAGLNDNTGFNSKEEVQNKVVVRLRVANLGTKEQNTLYGTIGKVIELMRSGEIDFNKNENLNQLRTAIGDITAFNKNNDNTDGTVTKPYFKIHKQYIEFLAYGDTKLVRIYFNKGKASSTVVVHSFDNNAGDYNTWAGFRKMVGAKELEANFDQQTGEKAREIVLAALATKQHQISLAKIKSGQISAKQLMDEKKLLADVGKVVDSKGKGVTNFVPKENREKTSNLVISVASGINDGTNTQVKTAFPVIEKAKPAKKPTTQPAAEDDDIAALRKFMEDNPTETDERYDALTMQVVGPIATEVSVSIEERTANWERMFGKNVPFDPNVDGLIRYKGKLAYGLFSQAAVQLSKFAPVGAEAHEAFHVAMHIYLSEEARAKIYAEAKAKYGDLTERQLEELLAEDFRLFAITNKTKQTGIIRTFFNRLKAFIENILGKYSTDRLFNEINSGYFNYAPTAKSLEYARKIGMTMEATPEDIYGAANLDQYVNYMTGIVNQWIGEHPNVTMKERSNNNDLNIRLVTKDQLKLHLGTLLNELDTVTDKNRLVSIIQAGKIIKSLILDLDTKDSALWAKVVDNADRLLNLRIEEEVEFEGNNKLNKDWDDRLAYSRSSKESFDFDLKRIIMATRAVDEYTQTEDGMMYTYKQENAALLPTFINFDYVYGHLASQMANARDVEEMMARLANMAQADPSFMLLWERINGNPLFQAKWFSNFNKTFIEADHHRIVSTDVGLRVTKSISNKRYTLADNWLSTINALVFESNKHDNSFFNSTFKIKVTKLLEETTALFRNAESTPLEIATSLSKLANEIGIDLPADIILKIGDNQALADGKTWQETVNTLINKPLSIIMRGFTRTIDTGNPIKFENRGRLNELAAVTNFFIFDSTENSYFGVDGNMRFSLSKPSFITDWFDDINQLLNPFTVLKKKAKLRVLRKFQAYAQDPSFQASNWLWSTKNKPGIFNVPHTTNVMSLTVDNLNMDFISNFSFTKDDGLKNINKRKGAGYDAQSTQDWDISNLLKYFTGRNSSMATYPIVVQSDSGNMWNITSTRISIYENGVPAVDEKGNISNTSKLYQALFNTINQELIRMKQARELLFTVDPVTQELKVKEGIEYGALQVRYHYQKLDENGVPILLVDGKPTGRVFRFDNMTFADNTGKLQTLNNRGITYNGMYRAEAHTQETTQIIDKFIREFVKSQVIAGNAKYKGYKEVLANSKDNFGSTILGLYNDVGKVTAYQSAITELMLNTYLTYVEHGNFINGNISEYKDNKDTNKRAKQSSSPRQILSTIFRGKTYKGITFADIEITSSFYDGMVENVAKQLIAKGGYDGLSYDAAKMRKKTLPDNSNTLEKDIHFITSGYLSINRADAQSYNTIDRYKATMQDAGRWNNVSEAAFLKIKVGEDLTASELKGFLQVIKPFYYDNVYDSRIGKMRSRQLKNSILPLIPQLVKGTAMAKVLAAMETAGIEEAYFQSATKVGMGFINKITDDLGNLTEGFDANLVTETYFNAHWGLQLDVPSHLKDQENKLGVQVSKILIANLSNDAIYQYKGSSITGKELREKYFDLLSANIEDSARSLLKRIGAKQVNGTWTIEDLTKIQEVLVSELESRGLSKNYTEALEFVTDSLTGEKVFNLPLFVSNMSTKFESVLTSLFTNNVTNQKFPGGHVVLASDALITQYDNVIKPTTKEPTVGDIVTIDYYFAGQDKLVPVKAKINKLEKYYQGKSRTTLPNGEVIENPGTLEYYVELTNVNNNKVYKVTVDTSGIIEQTHGKGIFIGGDNYIKEFDIKNSISEKNTINATGINFRNEVMDRVVNGTFRLNPPILENGRIVEAEALLPAWSKKFFNEDGTRMDINDLPEELLVMIGYRIPTEAKYSVPVIKVVGFLPEGHDSTIVLPYELITQTGWDFDVDSFYIMQRSFEGSVAEGFKLVTDESTRAGRNNAIFDIYMAILTNPYHYVENINPGKFTDPVALKKRQEFLTGVAVDDINPNTRDGQDFFRNTNIAGRALKGLAANSNGILPVLQNIEAEFGQGFTFTMAYDLSKYSEQELRDKYGEDVIIEGTTAIVTHRKIGHSPDGSFTNINGDVTTDHAAQMLAMILDIVKEGLPYNINTYTFDTFMAMLTTGIDINHAGMFMRQPIINSLAEFKLNSDGILANSTTRPMEYMRRDYQTRLYKLMVMEGIISKEDAVKRGLAINNENGFYFKKNKTIWLTHKNNDETKLASAVLGFDSRDTKTWTLRELEAGIAASNVNNTDAIKAEGFKGWADMSNLEKIDYFKNQLTVLEMFTRYKKSGDAFSAIMKVLNTDKLGAGPSLSVTNLWYENYDVANGINPFTGAPGDIPIVVGNKSAVDAVFQDGAYKPMNAYKTWANDLSYSVLSKLFIEYSKAIQQTRSSIYSVLGRPNTEKDGVIYTFMKQMLNNKLSYFKKFDPKQVLGIDLELQLTLDITDSTNLEAFTKLSTANKVQLVKTQLVEAYSENRAHMLHFLKPKLDENSLDNNEIHRLDFSKPNSSDGIDNLVIDSFDEMFDSDNPFIKHLAEDLLAYNYFTTGITFNKSSYATYIPSRVMVSEDYMNMRNELQIWKTLSDNDGGLFVRRGESTNSDIVDIFMRNSWNNDIIVPKVKSRYVRDAEGNFITNEESGSNETVDGTPDWNFHNSGAVLAVNSADLNKEDPNIRNASYILLSKFVDGALETTLMKRYFSEEALTEEDVEKATPKEDTIYYYPVSKLSTSNSGYEFSQTSIFKENNVPYTEDLYVEQIDGLKSGEYKSLMDIINERKAKNDDNIRGC